MNEKDKVELADEIQNSLNTARLLRRDNQTMILGTILLAIDRTVNRWERRERRKECTK